MNKFVKGVLVLVLVGSLGLMASLALASNDKNPPGPPTTTPGNSGNNPGSPGDDCSHGNSGKECKPDPQPEHGKECEDHGNASGNEDHCDAVPPTTTSTPSTTTTVQTTSTTGTTSTTTPGTTSTEVTTSTTATTPPIQTTPSGTVPGTTSTTSTPPQGGGNPPISTSTESSTSTTTPVTTDEAPPPDAAPTKLELQEELKKQVAQKGTGRTDSVQASDGQLPHTGLPLWIVALAGATMTGSGLLLRRKSNLI